MNPQRERNGDGRVAAATLERSAPDVVAEPFAVETPASPHGNPQAALDPAPEPRFQTAFDPRSVILAAAGTVEIEPAPAVCRHNRDLKAEYDRLMANAPRSSPSSPTRRCRLIGNGVQKSQKRA